MIALQRVCLFVSTFFPNFRYVEDKTISARNQELPGHEAMQYSTITAKSLMFIVCPLLLHFSMVSISENILPIDTDAFRLIHCQADNLKKKASKSNALQLDQSRHLALDEV